MGGDVHQRSRALGPSNDMSETVVWEVFFHRVRMAVVEMCCGVKTRGSRRGWRVLVK